MICRQCLRRATTVARQPALTRPLSTFPALRTAAEAAPPTPSAAKEPAAEPKSVCAAGTTLTGLNYFKGREDPVARADEEYPDWLWRCLEFPERSATADDAAAAEFCKPLSCSPLAFPAPLITSLKLEEGGIRYEHR